MIRSIRHRGLRELFERGRSRHVRGDLIRRCQLRLSTLNAAESLDDLRSLHSLALHELRGQRAGTYSIRVNAQWRITFRFEDGEALDVDLEQYH